MTLNKLGQTDLHVNPIGFGANAIGGHNLYTDIDENANKDLVKYALDSGVNLIDTAYAYGNGRSEELIGEVLQEVGGRDKLYIATKAAHDPNQDGNFNNSPEFLKKAVDKALERLQTDYIDLFYIHFPDEETPKDEAVAALKEIKDAGKIRAIGVSNFSLDQIKEANKDGHVDVVQDFYNLLHRQAETELFPYLEENKISFVPYFPFQSGLLTGKYKGDESFPEGDLRSGQDDFKGDLFQENIQKVNQLKPIAQAKGVEVANIVLAFYLEQGPIDLVIPGAKRPEQIDSNLKTLEVDLTAEEIKQISDIFQ